MIKIIRRPKKLSNDLASSEEALIHVLNFFKCENGSDPNYVIFLQCTSPFRKKNDIEEYLIKNEFPKKKMDDKNNYDYLIKMPIWNLTYEKKEELLKELNNKKDILSNIKNKKLEKMWLEDLEVFEKDYNKYYDNRINNLSNTTKKRSKVKV